MRLKSYFAQSIGEAIESARLELGPEAMLLNSRKTSPEQSYLGEFEVVFGVTGNPPAQKKSAPAEPPVSSKLSTAKRIFPELVASSSPEPSGSEEQASLAAKLAGSKRIFGELALPDARQHQLAKIEAPAVIEAAIAKPVSTETVTIEAENAAIVETDARVATKPLFPKLSVPAPTASTPASDNSVVTAPKPPAPEVPAAPPEASQKQAPEI